MHGLVAQSASMHPEAIAVSDDGEHNDGERMAISYKELDRLTNVLSRELVAGGLQSEDCVAVALHRSVSMVVALLAIQKAGGAFVALDPSHPAERKVASSCPCDDSTPQGLTCFPVGRRSC